jgi:glutaredoxin 3
MSKITVYATTYCWYCRAAEALLKKKGIAFERIDVTGDRETRRWLVQATGGRRTVPQIFIDGDAIGGYDELAALDRTGELDRRLAS